ncbi:protein NLRC5-like, partial [Micropterus dolomieu]|uniref:protein NLRC5-like n=1 Tax=Micropterus dolomieu TaxID=147949 RepID=UPI001E8DDF14
MACTTQSALDYVKSARVHLERDLNNLSVVVENLYQKEVFSDKEVSKIQAERDDYDKTRRILDSVTKKGEAACYEFLRIIDVMRKRTLGRTSLLPETKSSASTETKKFDLHNWISCFSFKDDTQMDINYLQGSRPCLRYQAKLKSKAQKMSNEFWKANKNQFEGNNKPDLSYANLVLDTQESVSPSKIKKLKSKKSKISRHKKLKAYIPEDRPDISPSDLLKTDKNILLVGKPGIGKTALTHEMLKLWAERDNKELDYMFYFDMRETSHIMMAKSLEDLLFSVISEPDEGKEEVLQDIKKNSDNVTLIFDGITDLSSSVVKRLVEKDLLPDAKIIMTCRPDDEEDIHSEDFLRVEVKGFSEQTIKTYFSATLGKEQEKVLSNLELLTLCHVPMYALMVAVCFSSETPEDSPQPCTVTEIYINIVRHCLQTISKKTKTKDLNSFINNKSEEILSLAEFAFKATEGKTVILTELPCEDSCVLSFLKPLVIKVAPTETITTHAFLHYTMQEFFAALWLLKNPDKIGDVFQQSLTEEKKHMKHLIPFMCRLLTDKRPSLMKHLTPAQELKNTSDWFFEELITTFSPRLCEKDEAESEDSGLYVDILFLCQCFYESQCPEACIYFLEELDYHLDLSGESLEPYLCSAVAYVVTQSKERKIWLNLEDVMVSEQGMRRLLGCLQNVQWCGPLPRQLWEIFLLSEDRWQMDHISLLSLDGNQLHLPVEGKRRLFERAVKVMQKITTQVNICLHWDRETPACQSLCETLLEALPYIRSLSFRRTYSGPGSQDQQQSQGTLEREEKELLLDLCLRAALHKGESFHRVANKLLSLFSVNTDLHNILLVFYQHVKSKGCSDVIPKLRALFQSAPAVWSINLSERKTSILLEVLKLQPEKKPVELTGCSDEESEVRSFLQCLPYISQLSVSQQFRGSGEVKFFGNLFCAAAEREQQTGEKILELLSPVCRYQSFPLKEKWCDFLLDLYSHDPETGLRVLPSLQSVFQSAPAVWSINLSERKTSILLEVLKLQPEKKPVELTGWSDEESEVRSFLQCLPYISQLSVSQRFRGSGGVKFFGNLFCAAAEREQQTGEKILELLSSVCRYQTFPLKDRYMDDGKHKYQCGFLLDLYSHLKDYETKTGLRVLPSLQSVFQSAPAVWSINLSERKTSILLEVLKLQPEKKPVELTGCSDEESEVRSFLQCLPYISQLSCDPEFFQSLCAVISVRSREAEQLASVLQLLGFSLLLTGELHRKTCRSVGRVLRLCGSDVDLVLTPRKMSVRGASLLFSCTTQLHSLRLSSDMALLLSRWVRRGRAACPLAVEELSLAPQKSRPSDRVLLKVVSSLASLLRSWAVRRLDLTEFCVPAQGLIPLLLHDGPLTIKLSQEIFQQLLSLLHEVQDEVLTRSFLSKVGGDLNSCCLNWELLHYLLQQSSAQTIAVNLRKNLFLQESVTRLLPFLDRIVFK